MTNKYFCKDVPLNANIDRHRLKQKELESYIIELESLPELDEFQSGILNIYRGLLSKLLQSKAEVVSKLGKKGE